ncbi:MAG: hypothetical protein N4A59_14905 [Marinifilum sp.]|jgi:hypothetical protein|nr:hypothetical protein [Marinifilum sp.]
MIRLIISISVFGIHGKNGLLICLEQVVFNGITPFTRLIHWSMPRNKGKTVKTSRIIHVILGYTPYCLPAEPENKYNIRHKNMIRLIISISIFGIHGKTGY